MKVSVFPCPVRSEVKVQGIKVRTDLSHCEGNKIILFSSELLVCISCTGGVFWRLCVMHHVITLEGTLITYLAFFSTTAAGLKDYILTQTTIIS